MIITEERLAQAILEYDDLLMASLPDPSECVHVFSASFERRMKKLIRKADHYVAYRVLKYAAAILIAFLLSASMFLSFNAEARATVVNWVKESFEGAYRYFFTAEDVKSPEEYELGWMPDGYKLAESFEYLEGKTLNYVNNEGKLINLTYMKGSDVISYTLGDENYEEKHIVENDFQADIYISLQETKSNGITWVSQSEEIIFTISSFEKEDILVKMAKSVAVK